MNSPHHKEFSIFVASDAHLSTEALGRGVSLIHEKRATAGKELVVMVKQEHVDQFRKRMCFLGFPPKDLSEENK